jgi:BolA protein
MVPAPDGDKPPRHPASPASRLLTAGQAASDGIGNSRDMSMADTVRNRMETKLVAAYAPARLEVIDESERHRGHAGWREGGETHFRIRIAAAAFAGKSRVERHRMVNATLAEELAGRVHALTIEAEAD